MEQNDIKDLEMNLSTEMETLQAAQKYMTLLRNRKSSAYTEAKEQYQMSTKRINEYQDKLKQLGQTLDKQNANVLIFAYKS